MTSPYSTGGGGVQLEATVASSALVAILCEASFRGLPGTRATEINTQRSAFDEPLDDLIITGQTASGATTKLHLQIKNKISFTANNQNWQDVVRSAWDTFSQNGFDPALERIGAGIGTYNALVDSDYQSVLKWAEYSTDGDHFIERIEKKDFSNKAKLDFVEAIRTILKKHSGRSLTADEIWRFLKCFVIVHFDFQSNETSRDEAYAIDRIKSTTPTSSTDDARRIWDHLFNEARTIIPVGGGATRPTIIEHLNKAGLSVNQAPSYQKDLETIDLESQRALADIKSTIAGVHIHRSDAYQQVCKALGQSKFVQIIGEPGCGKSALLKAVAEETQRIGRVFVLKDGRIHPRGWRAHAHTLEISNDVNSLLREFACAGDSVLFIDGIDKIVDPAIQLTVNDVLRAIAEDDGLADWRILITTREQNLNHIKTWIDESVLKKLLMDTIRVGPLNQVQLSVISEKVPRLRPLIAQSGNLDVVISRPFFLDAIVSLTREGATGQLPASEVELLELWWELGGSDNVDFSSAQERRTTLLDLGERLVSSPDQAISIRNLKSLSLGELKTAGILRDKQLGHTVEFTHDIYEEWVICEVLIGKNDDIPAFLKGVGQPLLLARPTQLFGTYLLEKSATPDKWENLLGELEAEDLRPIWQRSVLTSSFQSTQATKLLSKISPILLHSDCELLKKLLLAIETLEVVPNTLFLREDIYPDLSPEERVQFANFSAFPKSLIWVRFLDWLVPNIDNLPKSLIPELLPIFSVWQKTHAGQNVRHCKEIGTFCYSWLLEIEKTLHPDSWHDRRKPFGLDIRYQDEEKLEKKLRSIFLSSAGDVPELVKRYLSEKSAEKGKKRKEREGILDNSIALIQHLPEELVDYILDVFLEYPNDHRDPYGGYQDHLTRNLGISGHHEFYPASPVQMPFLALLRQNEAEGLRLVHTLCNHSVEIWRWSCRNRSFREPVTPLPIHISFPWGRQSFWGDGQVYLWFRGYWGNDAVRSALMALEQWALEQVEGGHPFEEVFQKVVKGNKSVAILGLVTSLCLAYPDKAVSMSIPLVTCPYLWEWDIARFVQDSGSPSNEIGNWHQYKFQLSAVRNLNQRSHRKQDIRALLAQLIFNKDEKLRGRYLRGIRSFPKRLPILYEEEKQYSDHLLALKEKMQLFSEQGDPKHLKTAPTEDGKHIQVWIDPPSLSKPKYKEQNKEHTQQNKYSGLALWAVKSLDEDKLNEHLTVKSALRDGQSYFEEGLFDQRFGITDFIKSQQASAVSGAAYVVARFCSETNWNEDTGAWCLDVLQQAATAPEQKDDISIRGSHLTMHPAVFAAHGYSALMARGFEIELCKAGLLNLAVDALEHVIGAVYTATKYYAPEHAEFVWVLLDIGIRQCLLDQDEIPNYHSPYWDNREAAFKVGLLDRAEKLLENPTDVSLPSIPMPWIKNSPPSSMQGERDTKGYGRNNLVLMYNVVEHVLFKLDYSVLLQNDQKRANFLKLVDQLLDWTVQEIIPPFADNRRSDYGGNTPFEWVSGFSWWCGRLCTHLNAEETSAILRKIYAQDNETALLIMQSFMRAFMIEGILLAEKISYENLKSWTEITDWVFDNPEWRPDQRDDYLDREFQSCVHSTLFCASSDFSPLICGVDRGWSNWDLFSSVVERSIKQFSKNKHLYYAVTVFLKGGGFDLLPEPALTWLENIVVAEKGNQKFWHENGEITVEILKMLMDEKSDKLASSHRNSITLIADILVDNGVRGAGIFQQELLRN